MKDAARRMLIERLIPFWAGLRDAEHGGFYGWMDYELRVDREAVKGCILNSRILWFFSEAARLTGSETARECADHAYRFMTERCFDREHGGLYWSVTYDGRPDDTTKHTYNQAFGIYALSAYHRLTGDADALAAAWSLYDVIEGHCSDAGGYLEAFTRDWGPESNEKLSENGVMAQRTMNTLLHVFEGYSGLYEVTRDPRAEKALRRMLDIYAEKVFDPVRDRQRVFFDLDYNELIDLHSYGHDIESSWLIDWGADLLGDEALSGRIHAIDSRLARNIYARAYRDHSLLNECERGVDNTWRIWWVQAEAVLGFEHEYQKSGDLKFRAAAEDIWRYIETRLTDPRTGEWFWQLDAHGNPDPQKPIVEPWKCPYHNGRLCMRLMEGRV